MLCNAVVSFAQEEMELVAGAEGKGLALVELLLSLTGCDLPRIPILTLDFWLELQVRHFFFCVTSKLFFLPVVTTIIMLYRVLY